MRHDKILFDAARAVIGPMRQGEVAQIKAAIATIVRGCDTAYFDVVRSLDDDKRLDPVEFRILRRAVDAWFDGEARVEKAAPRQVSERGRALITEFEGERLVAYLCPAKVWTIGVGHTGPDVKPGMSITHKKSQQLLDADLDRFEEAVWTLAPNTSQSQFDALVSLAFNIGIANFRRSSVLRHHRAGQHKRAAASFAMWCKARVGGKLRQLPGLVRRRAAEAKLYSEALS